MARDVVEAAAAADGRHHHKAVVAADGGGGGGAGTAALVWDCGSALYDSYELTSFRRQLDAAVLSCGGRSLSMPHLLSSSSTQQQQMPAGRRRRRRRRLPAMLRRLFGKVLLRLRFPVASRAARGGWYDYGAHGDGRPGSPWSGALTSIPEESASPENGPSSSPLVDDDGPSALRKAQSERFVGSKTASSMVQFDVVL
ncbi:uncharacterized protein [Oryza sativa Japonica Group]|jgi:hypothetical protein|uniref:Avr9/Cf-9 rapidly elicited protein 194 n=3 Tax=Oryza TaxID=4527 RepID=Q653B0_ORYSJ|nr:uncharacterized protein LOC9272382 [Oryza sativa Japonica Group]KAB8102688.1 hypothetical protein EE612_034577 [Oryza sativa]KAF2927035.1 hypothetical protein DAI22_06g172400 [Oryza sativa Japonica Group]QQV74254.1 avr9/Cf-9 rapidly elicited protein 194 [Oryza sativa Japonica Group]BAD45688.1 hypothetical protein [Oryza sativa Japonica Group]BAD46107.1 hypothetical protein [Oryza sativa Japonica Group]|eukprot:NP_001174826.1 Os06g0525200 [Oryza sativa Japonica Group]